ncbi:hypothetical protein NQ318_019141 [Aromia moschata]|uniref:Cytochrome P450 n=1 Tax=Aromia moschata TaxID=1265417 RepID=A0AAV8YTC2_9CUCU|nr:hypothetical protein NQ318_019141 [Aromia moschata]
MWLIIIAVAVIAALVYAYLVRFYSFWKNKGVQQGKTTFIFGDNWDTVFGKYSSADLVRYVYNKCPGTRYSGMYSFIVPLLIVKDPDLIKRVTVKDFDHFTDHLTFIAPEFDTLWSKNLFALKGQKWREMRNILSPSFTSSKMKAMFVLIVECAENFVQHFLNKNEEIITVELKDIFTRFTNDMIASIAFGIKVDSLAEPNNEFYLKGKQVTDISSPSKTIQWLLYKLVPQLNKIKKVTVFDDVVANFFRNVVDETLKMRGGERDLRKGEQKQDDKDVIDTGFATAQDSATVNEKLTVNLTNEDITAQALIFFFAGFDSISSLICFSSYEIAINQNIQNRLRQEIRETLKDCGGKLTYDGLMKMKYLDMIISETLRKWPTNVAVDRVCTKAYTIDPVSPDEKPVHLEEGVYLWLPLFAIHRDPEYYPDPERFDPERFSDENKGNIRPYTYFPFGLGPRNCIGSRLALLEAKTLLFYLILNFEIVPVKESVIPVKISQRSFQLSAQDGFWFGLKRIVIYIIENHTMLGIILGTVLFLVVFYYIAVKPYDYWRDKGVKQGKPLWLLGDTWRTLFRIHNLYDSMVYLYNLCPGTRYSGMYDFTIPSLIIRDPDLIKQVTVKDFDHFVDHRAIIPEGVDPVWTSNLIGLKGQKWREMRAILSPSFTTSKMRAMFVLIEECGANFVQYFLDKGEDTVSIELKDTCRRFANDVIATTAFGVKVDSLKDRDNEFYRMGKEATNFTGFVMFLKVVGYLLFPRLFGALKVKIFSGEVGDFFVNLVDETIKVREEKGIVRPDMIHLMMEAQKGIQKQEESPTIDTGFATAQESDIVKTNDKQLKNITNADIASQALIFFLAGFDTVSTHMCFLMYELAMNFDIQEKLREEVRETLKECGGKLTYEGISKMKYMDMVISEALRKWPPAVATDRVCTKPYTIEPKMPGEKPVQLKEGSTLFFPLYAIHQDPEYYPDPERFDPERFNEENKQNIKPYTYFPFGLGPRNCIGSRFALLEVKTTIFHLLLHFQLVPVEKTMIPLKISKKTVTISFDGGLWIGLKRLKE